MSWIAARQKDPVPMLLTIGGCVISAAAVLVGLTFDARGVVANVVADLSLIGPALFLSNIIVKRIQDARARDRIAPLVHVVAQLLHWAVPTANHALELLGVPTVVGAGDSPQRMTLAGVESALAEASRRLETATNGTALPASFPVCRQPSFPRFGMIRKLVQQADQNYPMPRSVAVANIAEEWAQRCAVDFVHPQDGHGTHQRHVGLTQIEAQSEDAEATTRVDADTYLHTVRDCVRTAHAVAHRLTEEAPAGLPDEVPANAIDVGRTAMG